MNWIKRSGWKRGIEGTFGEGRRTLLDPSGIPLFLLFSAIGVASGLSFHLWGMVPLKYVMWAFFSLSGFTLYFFRDPPRTPHRGRGWILSAADGKVMAIRTVEEGVQISVFLSLFNVHVNRIPISGRVEHVEHIPGRFSLAFRERASEQNEYTRIVIVQGPYRVVVKQIAGKVARRIVCMLKEGDRVEQGQRFGMIQFGSRVDLIVPAHTVLRVKVGDRVKAGQSIIGVVYETAS